MQVKNLEEMYLEQIHTNSIIVPYLQCGKQGKAIALSTFNGLMNFPPPPMQIKSFSEIQDNFSEVYKQIADISMQNNLHMNSVSVKLKEKNANQSI